MRIFEYSIQQITLKKYYGFHKKIKATQLFSTFIIIEIFLKHQISILELFLKDHVTLKTEVMAAKNPALNEKT